MTELTELAAQIETLTPVDDYVTVQIGIDQVGEVVARLRGPSIGEDGPCFYCGEQTCSVAGDPGRWPLVFCQPEGTGIVRFHHTSCVTERLAALAATPAEDTPETVKAEVRYFDEHAERFADAHKGLAATPAVGGEALGDCKVQQEPVAWRYRWSAPVDALWETVSDQIMLPTNRDGWQVEPLYAAQPASPLRTGAEPSIEILEDALGQISAWCDAHGKMPLERITEFLDRIATSPLRGREIEATALAETFRTYHRRFKSQNNQPRGYYLLSEEEVGLIADALAASQEHPASPFIPGESIELAHRAQRERRAAEFGCPEQPVADPVRRISMDDVRLVAGEGKLTAHDVLEACNAVMRMRSDRAQPRYLSGCLRDGVCRGVCENANCPNHDMVVAARVCVEPKEDGIMYPATEGMK